MKLPLGAKFIWTDPNSNLELTRTIILKCQDQCQDHFEKKNTQGFDYSLKEGDSRPISLMYS